MLRESQKLELKAALSADFKKEVIAFANSDGGTIYIGIADDGRVVGVANADQMMADISNMIRDGIRPDLAPFTSIALVRMDDTDVVKIDVQRGIKRPYHLADKGMKPSGVYIRHGVVSAPASEDVIRALLRDSDGVRYEVARSADQELSFTFTSRYFEQNNLSFSEENRRTLGLLDADGYHTHAALLFSDQCMHSIKCAMYDDDLGDRFRDRKEFGGSLLQQMTDAYAYLSMNNHLRGTIEGLQRQELSDYPEAAMREALINAIVHRDYEYSGSILVHVYQSRMEIVSLGGLVKGISMADILRGVSQPRNPLVSGIFYRLRLIESYGTGIRRIRNQYAAYPVQPSFQAGPASFLTVLPNRNEQIGHKENQHHTPEDEVLDLIRTRGEITRKQVEERLGCSQFPAQKLLQRLVAEGKILRIGAARSTKYRMA